MISIKDKKFILLIIAVILVIPGWIVFAYLPVIRAVDSLAGECAMLEDEISRKRGDIENIRAIYDEVGRLNLELGAVLNSLGSTDSIPEFIRNLKTEMASFGLTHIEIVPRLADLVEEKSYDLGERSVSRVELKVQALGGYVSLGKYIEHIQKLACFSEQSALSVNYDRETAPKSKLVYSFFVLLENRGF